MDIALSQLNLVTGVWERLQTLAADEINDGSVNVTFPSEFGGLVSPDDVAEPVNETRPVAIEIVLSSTPAMINSSSSLQKKRETSTLLSIVGFVKRWSPVAFFTRVVASAALRAACELWCSQQPEGIGQTLLDQVLPCPPTLQQARAPNSGLTEDVGPARFLSQNFFHRGADACFRQTTFQA